MNQVFVDTAAWIALLNIDDFWLKPSCLLPSASCLTSHLTGVCKPDLV